MSLFSASTAYAFSDISGHVFEPEIKYISDAGLVTGYDDGTYKPDALINRAEFSKIIIGAVVDGIDISASGNCFYDVKVEWFASYVCYAKEHGIIKGYEDGYFRPDNNISFAEAAKIIIMGIDGSSIPDTVGVEWYVPYVEKLKYYNAIPGTINFKPPNTTYITRGEMAYMIAALLKKDAPSGTQVVSDKYLSPSGNIYGNADAGISIVTFTDFECPYCASFHSVLKRIVGESKGGVNLEYINFPLAMHPNATFEAAASECVAKLGTNDNYWIFVDKLFANSFADIDSIKDTVTATGVDILDFTDCMADGAPWITVEKDYKLGESIGVNGTPASIIFKNSTGAYETVEGTQTIAFMNDIIAKVAAK
jgi:protein-disulfide isomerase